MLQLLVALSNLPLPALLITLAGCFALLFLVVILVACVPSAGDRLARFLALVKELVYSGPATRSSRFRKRSM